MLRDLHHIARRMGADRVEVAQQGDVLLWLCFLQVGQICSTISLLFRWHGLSVPVGKANVREFWAGRRRRRRMS